jgi:membrane-associated phospholipid phosphatase
MFLLLSLFVIFILPKRTMAKYLDAGEVGDILQIAIPSYAFGLAMNENDYVAAKQFSYSFLSMQITIEVLKNLTKEKRPDYKIGDKKDSFPSGHTAAVFSAATFIHKRYGLERATVPYILASFVGYSRIEAKKHHIRDVVAGALISSLCTWLFVDKGSNLILYSDGIETGLKYNINF